MAPANLLVSELRAVLSSPRQFAKQKNKGWAAGRPRNTQRAADVPAGAVLGAVLGWLGAGRRVACHSDCAALRCSLYRSSAVASLAVHCRTWSHGLRRTAACTAGEECAGSEVALLG